MAESILRPSAEVLHREELAALEASDTHPRPANWRLSPRAVATFILGSRGQRLKRAGSKEEPGSGAEGAARRPGAPDAEIEISQKFFGDDALVERAVVTLASQRGLMLVGDPGTAKSMLSELLTAAISGTSLLTVQGSAATTEDNIKYSWNYALLLARGPVPEALVPSPLHTAMREGKLCRFEELTRCPLEVQDSLVSVMSDKVLLVPELRGDDAVVFAAEGFNLIATANSRDRGVNEMSAALKRRFNFETVRPIADLEMEVGLVEREAGRMLARSRVKSELPRDVVELLVTAFQELRTGESREGVRLEKPQAALSTAEAVGVAYAAGLHAYYYGDGEVRPADVVQHLPGAVVKDASDDLPRLAAYFELVVRERAKRRGGPWSAMLEAGKLLPKA
ncbi:MAG: AAA family ATPase [Polyangiaceae bacterium]|nr:AAA family ATPase [Polyangiaceae bacterium]